MTTEKPIGLEQYDNSLVTASELQEVCTDISELSGESWSDVADMLGISHDIFTYWLRNGGIDQGVWHKIERKVSKLKSDLEASWQSLDKFMANNPELIFNAGNQPEGEHGSIAIKGTIATIKLGTEEFSVKCTNGLRYIVELIAKYQSDTDHPDVSADHLNQLLHNPASSGMADYGSKVSEEVQSAINDLNIHIRAHSESKPAADFERQQMKTLLKELKSVEESINTGKMNALDGEKKLIELKGALDEYGFKGKPRSIDSAKNKSKLDGVRKNLKNSIDGIIKENKEVGHHFRNAIFQGSGPLFSDLAANNAADNRWLFSYRPQNPINWEIKR